VNTCPIAPRDATSRPAPLALLALALLALLALALLALALVCLPGEGPRPSVRRPAASHRAPPQSPANGTSA